MRKLSRFDQRIYDTLRILNRMPAKGRTAKQIAHLHRLPLGRVRYLMNEAVQCQNVRKIDGNRWVLL